MTTIQGYGRLGELFESISQYLNAGCTIDTLKKVYHDAEIGLIDRNETGICLNEKVIIDSIETVKKSLPSDFVCSNINTKVDTVIDEWNINVAPILTGVTCNSFEDFAMQVAKVAGQCIKYKSAEEAMKQQPVQTQQNQMFVDVNTLISENNYLKSINTSKDEEIKALKARLVALGQPV